MYIQSSAEYEERAVVNLDETVWARKALKSYFDLTKGLGCMDKSIEKKVIMIHVVLFVVCAACRIYCQMHMTEWSRYQYGNLFMIDLVFAKPLFYYSLGFLVAYFLARKAFREDLQLPYKALGIMGVVAFLLYVFAAGMLICVAVFHISPLPWGYSVNLTIILDYCGLLCIPGILFGLVVER